MVVAFECLSKAALAKKVKHFKSESKVIFENHIVVASFVIVAEVVLRFLLLLFLLRLLELGTNNLLGFKSQEEDLFVVKDFTLLIFGQAVLLQVMLENFRT